MRSVGRYQCRPVNTTFLLYLLLFYTPSCNFIHLLNNDLQIGEEFNMGKNLVVKAFKTYHVVPSQVMPFKFSPCELTYDKESKFFRFEIRLQYFRPHSSLPLILDPNFADDLILTCFYQSSHISFQAFVHRCILFHSELVALVASSLSRSS